jgi:hypothetical protein
MRPSSRMSSINRPRRKAPAEANREELSRIPVGPPAERLHVIKYSTFDDDYYFVCTNISSVHTNKLRRIYAIKYRSTL